MRLIDADQISIKPEYMHDICGVVMIRVEDIARILNDMPTIQPEPHWIPCSKETAPKSPLRVQIQLDNSWIITAYYDGEHWYAVPDIGDVIDGKHIEAWRELPSPYQQEEE